MKKAPETFKILEDAKKKRLIGLKTGKKISRSEKKSIKAELRRIKCRAVKLLNDLGE